MAVSGRAQNGIPLKRIVIASAARQSRTEGIVIAGEAWQSRMKDALTYMRLLHSVRNDIICFASASDQKEPGNFKPANVIASAARQSHKKLSTAAIGMNAWLLPVY